MRRLFGISREKFEETAFKYARAYVELFVSPCSKSDLYVIKSPVANEEFIQEVRDKFFGKKIWKFHVYEFANFTNEFKAKILDHILELVKKKVDENFEVSLLKKFEDELKENLRRIAERHTKPIKTFSEAVELGLATESELSLGRQKLWSYYKAMKAKEDRRRFIMSLAYELENPLEQDIALTRDVIVKLGAEKKYKSYRMTRNPIIPTYIVEYTSEKYGKALFSRPFEANIDAIIRKQMRPFTALPGLSEEERKEYEKMIYEEDKEALKQETERRNIKRRIISELLSGKYDEYLEKFREIEELFKQRIKFSQIDSKLWFDMQGNEFSTAQELIESHVDWFRPFINSILESAVPTVDGIVSDAVKRLDRIVEKVWNEIQVEKRVPEEVLPWRAEEVAVAAAYISYLTKIADYLDQKGFVKHADTIDNIIKTIATRIKK